MSRAKRSRQKENTKAAQVARAAAQKRQRRKSGAMRLATSLLAVGLLIGVLSVLFNSNDDGDKKADTTTTLPIPETTTAGSTLPPVLPAGCVDTVPETSTDRPTFTDAPAMDIDSTKTYTAKLTTSCGDITIALDAKNAPKGVNNFVFLARKGFFDGLTWHRAAKGFVIQGGDPAGNGSGGPGYQVATELPANGYEVGSVAYAKANNEASGTAGSQFFVATGASAPEGLAQKDADGGYQYGAFGTVTAGLENAQKIESLSPTTGDGTPTIPMYIFTVEITEG